MDKSLKFYSELSGKVLNSNTGYSSAKNTIKKLFQFESKDDHIETIKMRLTIIDSYYSTNLNMRYYGIDDIANRINSYYKSDKLLINELQAYINDPFSNDEMHDLFNSCYGIGKNGKEKGAAKSLISKYAYFLTGCNWPIYDKIVRETYPLIIKRFCISGIDSNLPKDISKFILAMNHLNTISGINDFNKLDNLLWLTGKILRGNLSLILNKQSYLNVIDKSNLKEFAGDFNQQFKIALFDNLESFHDSISEDLYEMIAFAKSMEKEELLIG